MDNYTKYNYAPERTGGVKCPVCSAMIPVSIMDIAFCRGVRCAVCGLELTIEPNASKAAIQASKVVVESQKSNRL